MPDSILFNGGTDQITFGMGTWAGTGAFTFAVVFKRTVESGAYTQIMEAAGTVRFTDVFEPANRPYVTANSNQDLPSTFPTIVIADGWMLWAFAKATGSDAGRHNFYKWSTTTWLDDPGNAAITSMTAGSGVQFSVPALPYGGNILIAAAWDSQLSDADIHTLIGGKPSWSIQAPKEAWRFDTLAAIPTFAAGGTSTQTSRTGTTLGSGDAPTGWTDGEDKSLPMQAARISYVGG